MPSFIACNYQAMYRYEHHSTSICSRLRHTLCSDKTVAMV